MEGAKVYTQGADGSWCKATVLAALGAGKYRVQPEPWEGAKDGTDNVNGHSVDPMEVDASNMEGGTLPFQNSSMPENGFPDMTTLDHLHEAALLHNLRVRFFAGGCPYTYTADIVIAVNPYAWFPQLYTDEMRKEYLVFDRSRLTPHVYATSSAAYSGLQETQTDQAILVSGESGAGKTETVKILMAHLALIASSDDSSHIRRIVESNPLLESFGNAQTVRNDNSSRFGKFIELELNSNCRLVGSRCRTYLLEKSRVVGQDAGERNYHIFYQMLATDPSIRSTFELGNTDYTRDTMRYTKLGASKTDTIEGQSDAQRFQGTISALALVAVEGDVLTRLLRALAGVLLLGQFDFKGSSGDTSSQDDQAVLSPDAAADVASAAAALGVQSSDLEKALTTRTIRTRNEQFVKPLPPSAASATRDALAKELYSRMFDWLVRQICSATSAPAGDVKRFVGLLDIFGFESFAINRFEQFCINFANEKLQQKFTHDVFKAVQQEYSEEGIPWDKIEFKDNTPVLALVESKLGIIAMLNEECVRPKGSDENFVSKLVSVHKADVAFSTPRVGKMRELQFTVAHYAGSVTYTTSGWLERNKDSISQDVVEMMQKSDNALISSVFGDGDQAGEAVETGAKKAADTVSTKFKNSLRELMDTIGKTDTQYVRCIKPNKNKSPKEVDNTMVVDQLRCAGVIEAIRISRAGFPARMPLKEFAQRFIILARALAAALFGICGEAAAREKAAAAVRTIDGGADAAAGCRALLLAVCFGEKQEQYQVGRTRVYFKSGVLEQLEERRSLLLQAAATVLSKRVRGRQAKHRFGEVRRVALQTQALQRMRKHRLAFKQLRDAVITCQSLRRAVFAKRLALSLRRERCAVLIQASWRRHRDMNTLCVKRCAAVRIQSIARRRACRKQYLIDLADSKEQAKLENQVKALQAKLEAQEKAMAAGTASGTVVERVSEPPAEILEALQALAAENAKLRMELDHVRSENNDLRRENNQLRGQSAKSEWFSSMVQTSRQSGGVKGEKHHKDRSRKHDPPSGMSTPRRVGGGSKEPSSSQAAEVSAPSPREGAEQATGVRLHQPLSPFWEDVPCSGLPLLKSGSEVHIKLGANLLMVDDNGKHLSWRKWMTTEGGYTLSQTFFIERRAPQRTGSSKKSSAMALEDGMPEDGCLGLAFALRSAKTMRYLVMGGMWDRYRVQVSGEKPEHAMVFTFVPLAESTSTPSVDGEAGVAAEYAFALRQLGENKMMKLRKDGYVSMSAVSEADIDINDDTIAASLEYLRPCASYEIVVHDKLVGLVVSKDLPLRVAGFNSMSMTGDHVPGPAELTGRIKLGDIIVTVNGQDIDGIPRQDALRMIACKRPVTLGFRVGADARVQIASRAAGNRRGTN